MDSKNTMLWAITLSIVAAAGSVAMYYQHLRIANKSRINQKLQDKLNQNEFYRSQIEQAYTAYLEDENNERVALKRYSQSKRGILNKMEADGYKKSEIDRIVSDAEAKALIADYCK